MFGIKDLVHDFKLTFHGDYYKDYKRFDSVEAITAHPESKGRMSRINQGLRYHGDGKHKTLAPKQSITSSGSLRMCEVPQKRMRYYINHY